MRTLGKVLLGIVIVLYAVCMVFIAGAFMDIPWVTGLMNQAMDGFAWLPVAIIALLAFGVVCVAVLFISMIRNIPENKEIMMKTALGKLEFTRKSIESVVRNAAGEFNSVICTRAKIQRNPKPDKLKVRLDIEPRNLSVNIRPVAEQVQARVAERLSTSFSIHTDRVRVKVIPHEESSHNRKHVPRVV